MTMKTLKATTTATALAAATLTSACADVAVQGFLGARGPDCLVGVDTPTVSRGVLDVGAATRYETVIRGRTSKDANLAVTTAEVSFALAGTAEQIGVFDAAMADLGVNTLACSGALCETQFPTVVTVVMSEAGIVDDERVILASLDLVTTEAGQTLAAVFDRAAELSGTPGFGPLEMNLQTVLIGTDGSRSQPAAFLIDVCDGCLAPDDATCRTLGATAISVSTDVCLPGQDEVSSACVCADGTPADAAGCP